MQSTICITIPPWAIISTERSHRTHPSEFWNHIWPMGPCRIRDTCITALQPLPDDSKTKEPDWVTKQRHQAFRTHHFMLITGMQTLFFDIKTKVFFSPVTTNQLQVRMFEQIMYLFCSQFMFCIIYSKYSIVFSNLSFYYLVVLKMLMWVNLYLFNTVKTDIFWKICWLS